ncbi:MarR family winged helix-turn-helix transcriptional regulator [Desertibacillus haloalkaliphilus]|uniref:MarR family winged helix-turn-helix transcriptional regulator n=1 Tax=Desertibacillus haloalkaliphilus TaxID=1328930 RepID=UPI0028A93BD2|nr:MarR family transcriptional regulator [Desertibacillus haloalkaliphilus]
MIIIVVNHQLFHSLHQLSRFLTKRANQALQPFDLYSAQWSVIYALKMKGTLTQKELCEYLAVEAPPLTRNIQRLVKKGYVRQVSGEDKRQKKIELTEEALAEFPKWEQAIMSVNQELIANVPQQAEAQLEELLTGWLLAISEQEGAKDE